MPQGLSPLCPEFAGITIFPSATLSLSQCTSTCSASATASISGVVAPALAFANWVIFPLSFHVCRQYDLIPRSIIRYYHAPDSLGRRLDHRDNFLLWPFW